MIGNVQLYMDEANSELWNKFYSLYIQSAQHSSSGTTGTANVANDKCYKYPVTKTYVAKYMTQSVYL